MLSKGASVCASFCGPRGFSLLAHLQPRGILALSISKPKQTTTTQRWKILLQQKGTLSYSTKIEFSRRLKVIRAETGIVAAPLLTHYQLMPFGARYYGASAIFIQKINALASPTRNALRDLFDLHHLLFTVGLTRTDIFKTEQLDAAAIEKTAVAPALGI